MIAACAIKVVPLMCEAHPCRPLSLPHLTVRTVLLLALGLLAPASCCSQDTDTSPMRAKTAFRQVEPDLFAWTDTCNVYVLKDGDAALLIDLGDGSVLEHLGDIGVSRIEWVLFTHHHREQCQGFPKLKSWNAKIAAPEVERALFEKPASFRKMKPSLGDAFTVHGASYVRPPLQPVPLDRAFKTMDDFAWRGHEFRCLDTRGNSPGSMSYFLKRGERWLAFSGDVMLDGAVMHNWFDTEWDYGFAAGIYALHNSASVLECHDPALLLPAHGPVIRDPRKQLKTYQKKLRELAALLVRGYEVSTFGAATQDVVSKPTAVPNLWQTTPHLFKFKGPEFWPNFTLLLADSGHALVVDCGLLDKAFLDKTLSLMKERLGLKQIDAAIVTHCHGDHALEAPHLRDKWGARLWTLDTIADKFQFPLRYDYCALIESYGAGIDSVAFDRTFRAGEKLSWEGYDLTVDWLPGQTEFGLCVQGVIDGRRVAFTGDNVFGDPSNPAQTGHEAVVARNSGILEEGYIYAADYLHRLKPDLLIGGHSFVMDRPADMIKRLRDWAPKLRDAFRGLSTFDDYRYMYDPFWVRAEPYRLTVAPGQSADFTLHVRNFRKRQQQHRIVIHAPDGLSAEPALLEGTVEREATLKVPLRLKAADSAPAGVHIVAFDVTLDGQRYGEWFDVIVNVSGAKR
ncbi:MAG: MBL fold metallo-hydrolase [Planctomycetota bacterium]|nr:MBL fold metallo-hydrolase [Planctomycetota bacterium]